MCAELAAFWYTKKQEITCNTKRKKKKNEILIEKEFLLPGSRRNTWTRKKTFSRCRKFWISIFFQHVSAVREEGGRSWRKLRKEKHWVRASLQQVSRYIRDQMLHVSSSSYRRLLLTRPGMWKLETRTGCRPSRYLIFHREASLMHFNSASKETKRLLPSKKQK